MYWYPVPVSNSGNPLFLPLWLRTRCSRTEQPKIIERLHKLPPPKSAKSGAKFSAIQSLPFIPVKCKKKYYILLYYTALFGMLQPLQGAVFGLICQKSSQKSGCRIGTPIFCIFLPANYFVFSTGSTLLNTAKFLYVIMRSMCWDPKNHFLYLVRFIIWLK